MPHFFYMAALLCCLAVPAVAVNDNSYLDYLAKNGLKVEECTAHSPSALFRSFLEREKLGYGGTPSHEAAVVDAFYQRYAEVLHPYNDTHHADVAKGRQALRELFYYITDAFEDATRERTYITHERVDAFTEHLISCLADSGMPTKACDLDLSADDAAAYLRARFVLVLSAAIPMPDFDAFRGNVASKLRQISKKHPIEARTLHYYVVVFADNYRTPLNPLIGAPE